MIRPQHRGAIAARQRCEEMWRVFQPLADRNFIREFPFKLHQRFFEMYLGASFISAGLEVRAPKPGPDFEIIAKGKRIFIEAVCATSGHPLHADAVPEPVHRDADGSPIAVQVPHDRITLRIASVVRDKLDTFDGYRRTGLITAGDACIIAVNPREIPQAWADAKEFFFRALYGVGNRYLVIDPKARQVVASGREHRTLLTRAGGAVEAVAPLLDPGKADVCAILGSSVDVANVPDLLGDDFVLMPHSSARVPLPQALIGRGLEIELRAGDESDSWSIEEIDYGAPEPSGPGTFSIEHEGAQYEGEWQVSGRELHVRLAGHGSDTPFRSVAGDPAAAARAIAIEMLKVYGAERCSKARMPGSGVEATRDR